MKISKETMLRTALTLVAMVNAVLIMAGKNPLPWSDEEIYVGLSALAAFLTTAWSWWKNNSFTQSAIKADEYLKEIKSTPIAAEKNGVISENKSLRLYDYERITGGGKTKEYPIKFTLSRRLSIKDQGNVSACCGCAIATVSEYLWNGEFSEGWNYGMFRTHKGAGLYVVKALELWKEIGTVPLADFGVLCEMPEIRSVVEKYPELTEISKRYRISGYASLNYADKSKKDQMIKDALMQKGVALLAISPSYFGECHAVALDGWNDEKGTYAIQNSWGSEWGFDGYGEIPKDAVDDVYAIFIDSVELPFEDVEKKRWSYKSIKHMFLSGLMNGTSDKRFEPEKPMTREEFATVTDRLCSRLDESFERLYDITNSMKG